MLVVRAWKVQLCDHVASRRGTGISQIPEANIIIDNKMTIIKTLILPILMYAFLVWEHACKYSQEILQRQENLSLRKATNAPQLRQLQLLLMKTAFESFATFRKEFKVRKNRLVVKFWLLCEMSVITSYGTSRFSKFCFCAFFNSHPDKFCWIWDYIPIVQFLLLHC